jgi:choline dehydrogenase-like flavoprotein
MRPAWPIYRPAGRTIVVLGAGALATPKLLLDSASAEWPNGGGKRFGMVGRNMMRHHIDLYAIFTRSEGANRGKPQGDRFQRSLLVDGKKLGSVQSFGFLPPRRSIAASMRRICATAGWRGPAPHSIWSSPAVTPLLSSVFSRTTILAGIMEDLPYPENRVSVAGTMRTGPLRSFPWLITLRDYDRARIDYVSGGD